MAQAQTTASPSITNQRNFSPSNAIGLSTVVGLGFGTIFGIALEKSKVFLPIIIREQLLLQNFTMLKMFLTASSVGIVGTSLLSTLGYVKITPRASTALGLGLLKGYGGNIVGGILLGSGMALSGACPGTVFAQLGAGVQHSLYTLGGIMTGSFLFAVFVSTMSKVATSVPFLRRGSSTSLTELISKSPSHFTVLSFILTLSAILFGTVVAVNQWKPWNVEIMDAFLSGPTPSSIIPSLKDQAWSPILAGAIIGVLQVASTLILGHSLGTSSSFITTLAYTSCMVDKNATIKLPYLARFKGNATDFWQLGLVSGIIWGSYLSLTLSGSQLVLASNMSAWTPFLGGILLICGARLAGGCTSGHGIAGLSHLSVSSAVTVACMFAGGVATAHMFFW